MTALPIATGRGSRGLFTGFAVLIAFLALAGFARTYYLKLAFGTPELTALKHLHGLVMTAWILLLIAQARLVAAGRTAIHRKLGLAGIALAAAVVFVGVDLAATSAREGFTPNAAIPPLVFLVMPIGEMAIFAILFTAAILFRRRPDIHKRLMIVATLGALTPAVARLILLTGLPAIPPLFFATTDILIVSCIAWDRVRNGRFHPAFLAGLGVVLALQAGRLLVARTEAWMQFARWLAT